MKINWLKWISVATLCLLITPVALLLYEGLGPLRNPKGYSYEIFRSIGLTLFSSGLAAVAAVIIFTPLSYYLARNKSTIMETLTDLPVSIPHPIVGIALLILASPLTPFGRFLESIGIYLFDTILGLVIALLVVSAPIYIKSMQPFYQSLNKSPEHFASAMGASPLRVFVSIVLPNSGRGILSAALISMSRAMSEFGAIAILAYYVLQWPFADVYPASVLIYQDYTYYGLGVAVTASAVMIMVAAVLMVALRLVQRSPSRK